MARYNGLIIPRSYNDYYSRSDPQAIRDIVALAADGELNAESKNPLQNQAIAKIVPNSASETNELADKNFVNSTVGTNTANYIYKTESGGEKVPFSSVAELEAYVGTVTNNDYAFVTGIDENGNTYYDRYKADVNDGVVTWAKEYRLNNSSFTAEQWAAIQSGITAEKVAQFEGAVAPVDVVQSGNMSALTSNSVYEALTNYINKTDATTLQQALQLPGVLSGAVAAGDNKAVTSNAVKTALKKYNYANATALTSSDDFNDIKSEGYYYCNGDIMPSNYPPISELVNLYNFILHVYPQGNTGRIVQEFTTINGQCKYIRFYDLISWSEWGKITTDKDNGNDRSIIIPKNGTVVTPIAVNAGNAQRTGFLLMIEGNISNEDATYCELYLIRVGYSGNHHTETLIHSNGNKASVNHTFGISSNGYLTISSNVQSRYYIF